MQCPACGISRLQSFNSCTDEEYRICHNAIMDQADVNLILNGGMHYSAGGKWSPVHC